MMAWIAPIAGAVISAAGSTAGGLAASKGGKGGAPKQIPLKGNAPTAGLQSYIARLLALNANTRGPSFSDWLASNGEARMELQDPGFTPIEAKQLRLVDPRGQPIPMFDQGDVGQPLTMEQLIYMGQERKRRRQDTPGGESWPTTPEERLANLTRRESRLEQILARDPGRRGAERRLSKVRGRIGNITDRGGSY